MKKVIFVDDVENQIRKINVGTNSIVMRIKELNSLLDDKSGYENKFNADEEFVNSL